MLKPTSRRRRQSGHVTIVRSASGGVRSYTGSCGTRLGFRRNLKYTSSKQVVRSSTKRYDGVGYHLLSARKLHTNGLILAKNGVQSGIGGSRQRGDENSIRRAVQTPKCIRARPSPLLSASPSPTEAEIS
eukprot:6155886-Pleurochrysis_carterae.AAC.1